jgi:hypothetical protein
VATSHFDVALVRRQRRPPHAAWTYATPMLARQFGAQALKYEASQIRGPAADEHGAVAQLGERCVRNAEVEGSTPFRST